MEIVHNTPHQKSISKKVKRYIKEHVTVGRSEKMELIDIRELNVTVTNYNGNPKFNVTQKNW